MKNLRLIASTPRKLSPHLGGISNICQNETHIYWLNGNKCWNIQEPNYEVTEYFDLPKDCNSKTPLSLKFVWSTQHLSLVYGEGSIYSFETESKMLNCMGVFESGIQACEWSPDMELLVVITGKNTLVIMTMEYDVLSESELHQDAFGSEKQVNVGWGDKTTQFHGSEGKGAAKANINTETQILPYDDKRTIITWRGDGQLFAVSAVNLNNVRQIRIFSRDGQLLSTGESIPNIEATLAWKPSGSLIASSQKHLNKHLIIFIEKNGLQHGHFDLRVGIEDWQVRDLAWSADSTVLLVWLRHLKTNADRITLWTSSNYHWFLKYSYQADKPCSIVNAFWDSESHNCLHLLLTEGRYWRLNFTCQVSSGPHGTVGILDGGEVLVTPLNKMVVPPPMSSYNLTIPGGVQEIVFLKEVLDSCQAIVITETHLLKIFSSEVKNESDWQGVKLKMKLPPNVPVLSLTTSLNLPECLDLSDMFLHHWTWVTSDLLYVVGSKVTSHVHCLQLNTSRGQIDLKSTAELDGIINCFEAYKVAAGIAIMYQLKDGKVIIENGHKQCLGVFPMIDKCSLVLVGDKLMSFFLLPSGFLHCDGAKVDSGVTSYILHDEFLLYTTAGHLLRCLSLQMMALGKFETDEVSTRNIERGSVLVTCDPSGTQVVLQMPRGNIEVIHPRCLVLNTISKLLDRPLPNYGDAFTLMKKHRINLNLMFDHNPEIALSNMDEIIKQLGNANSLCLLLTELSKDNFCKTIYAEWYNIFAPRSRELDDKVSVICDGMRTALAKSPDYPFLTLPLLTTYLKQGEVEGALKVVLNLPEGSPVSKDEAVQYLTYSVDIESLLDIAMGTYSLDAVLTVAEKSQRDPKLYLPFIRSIQHYEEDYRRFLIDKRLNRPLRALDNLSKCGQEKFEELVDYVVQEKLYKAACDCYPHDSEAYKILCLKWCDYLKGSQCHREAGQLYQSIGEYQAALDMFLVGVEHWRLALSCIDKIDLSVRDRREVLSNLVSQLRGKDNLEACAEIHLEYLNNVEDAIECLVEAYQYQRAYQLMCRSKRVDLIETHLIPISRSHGDNILEVMLSLRETIVEQETRLQEVRLEKKAKGEELTAFGEERPLGESDLFSETSSVTGRSVSTAGSRSGSRSTTSSKSRKKQNKKKFSTKRGNVFEDLGLIVALHETITRVGQLQDDVSGLLPVLVLTKQNKLGQKIQEGYIDLRSVVDGKLTKIWLPETKPNVYGPDSTVANILSRSNAASDADSLLELDPVYRYSPKLNKDKSWIQKILQNS